MTKKETDKLYDDTMKHLHGYRVTFAKQHYYKFINARLEEGIPIENIKYYLLVKFAIDAVRRASIWTDIRKDISMDEDEEIKEWWRKAYEVVGISQKEHLETVGLWSNRKDNSNEETN